MPVNYLQAEFREKDFECHCGKCTTPPEALKWLRIVHAAANEVVALLSEEEKVPDGRHLCLIVMSAYRCPEHNRAVGGELHSKHMLGQALDLKSAELEPERIASAIDRLQTNGKIPPGGLGRYPWGCHLDVRGERARWTGTRKTAASIGAHPGDVVGTP